MTNLPPVPGLAFATKKTVETGFPNSFAILGRDKSGKTRLGASAYDIPMLRGANKDVLIIEGEQGTASVAEFYPNVDLVKVRAFEDFQVQPSEEYPNGIMYGVASVLSQLLTQPHNYGVVVIDTYDKMQQYAIDYYLRVGASNTQQAWGQVKTWTLSTAWALHNSPILVIFLFHEDMVKDEASGRLVHSYKLSGAAGDTIGEVFDVIAHLEVQETSPGNIVRALQLGPKPGYPTGNRYESKLPAKLENATMSDIFAYLYPSNTAPSN